MLLLLLLLALDCSDALESAVVNVDASSSDHQRYFQVPPSFLGISHEPITMAKLIAGTPQYRGFIKLLSSFETGPFVLRWGGNEQDKLVDVLEDDQWESLGELHKATGARFMIGLNLMARDPKLAAGQIKGALKHLPPAAIISLGVGNEPDAFTFRGNRSIFPSDYWSKGWFEDLRWYCEELGPLLVQGFGTTKMISGPGFADMTRWREPQAKSFAGISPLRDYVSMLTAHYYTYRATSPGASYETFLDESKLELVHKKVRPWVRWARSYRIHFRLEETNSLAIQGLRGHSDTLAAALFFVDYALTMMGDGVHGMNFHDCWCTAYSPIVFPSLCLEKHAERGTCAETCGNPKVPPQIRAPFYGLLFVQMAVSELPRILPTTSIQVQATEGESSRGRGGTINIKAHVLLANEGRELRIVLVKKNQNETSATVKVVVRGSYGDGSLTLLEGPLFTSLADEITIAGQQVDGMGRLVDKRVVTEVKVKFQSQDESSEYFVELPVAAAALLIVRRKE